MRHLGVFAWILLIGTIAAGCSDRSINGGGDDDIIFENFPSAVGMLWKYEVTDSLTDHKDTVWVSVTEQRESTAIQLIYQWRVFRFGTGEVEDRVVVLTEAGVMIMLDTTQGEPDNIERFVTPFSSGTEWTGPFPGDTSRATYMRSCTVPAGRFTGVGRVERVWNRDFEGGGKWSEAWLDEEAGIIKRHFVTLVSDGTNLDTVQNEVWELYEYDLETFPISRYPGSVGTILRYQMVDDASGLTDTVTAMATERINNWGWFDSLIVWEYGGSHYSETHFVGHLANSTTFLIDTMSRPIPMAWMHHYPMCVGKHWGFAFLTPVPTIDDKAELTTDFENYATAFHYRMAGGVPGSWSVEEWLVPGIGVVQRNFTPYVGYPMPYQHWTLMDHQIGTD